MEHRTVNRRYRIDRRIGEGASATVYLGHDLIADCHVAIKALRPELAADRAVRDQFGRQATSAAALTHPNIVGILDLGDDQGSPFIVMEFVPGETLQDVTANEGPFGPDDVASLLEQVSAGLDFAHQRGVAHRCLTTQNILIQQSGVAKIINFGSTSGQTRAAHFLSPEQANGLVPTPSSDIYALGIIAFEMLTGTPLFQAESPTAVTMHHAHIAPIPPSSRFAGVPPIVDAMVLRATDKDPSHRFPTAGSFARAMVDWDARSAQTDVLSGIQSNGSYATDDQAENNDDETDRPVGRGLRARMSRLVGL